MMLMFFGDVEDRQDATPCNKDLPRAAALDTKDCAMECQVFQLEIVSGSLGLPRTLAVGEQCGCRTSCC